MDTYKIYTDGATSGNGNEDAKGGSAFIIIINGKIVNMQAFPVENATNNICELKAVLEACQRAQDWTGLYHWDAEYYVYTDSAYIVNCYKDKWYKKWQENGWLNSKKQPVANKELWQRLIPYFHDKRYHFEKVAGHSGDKYNEIVDKMAVAIRQGKGIEEYSNRWLGYEEEGN